MRRVPGGLFAQAMLIAMVVEVVGMGLTMAANFVTDSAAQTWQFVLVPVLALLIVGVKAGIAAAIKHPGEEQPESRDPRPGQPPGAPPGGQPGHLPGHLPPRQPGPGWPPPPRPRPPRSRAGISLASALLVLLVFCGGGGMAVMYGVGYGYGWVTGNEDGEDWLVEQASGVSGPLRMTVDEVLVTRHFTKVTVTMEHSADGSIEVPLFQNCRLIAADGPTMQPDNVRSDWSAAVSPGAPQQGVITFNGAPAEGRAVLSFARIFATRRMDPIAVPLRLHAPAANSALPGAGP